MAGCFLSLMSALLLSALTSYTVTCTIPFAGSRTSTILPSAIATTAISSIATGGTITWKYYTPFNAIATPSLAAVWQPLLLGVSW